MKKDPTKVNKVDPEKWAENNSWIYDEPLFSFNDLKKGINLQLYPALDPEQMQNILMKDLKQAAFSKAYGQALQKQRAAVKKELDELNDRLLFGEDLETFKKQWDKPGSWQAAPSPDRIEELFAEFRIRLFWWYVDNMEQSGSEWDFTNVLSFVNNIASHLGDPSRQPAITKTEKDGTNQSPTGCADC